MQDALIAGATTGPSSLCGAGIGIGEGQGDAGDGWWRTMFGSAGTGDGVHRKETLIDRVQGVHNRGFCRSHSMLHPVESSHY
jgi:hypothetical protein